MQPIIRVRAVLAVALATLVAASLAAPTAVATQGEPVRRGATLYPRPSAREVRLGDHLELRKKKRIHIVHRKIAPGLFYTKIIDEKTPRRIFILRADVANFPLTYDITLAGPTLGYRATVPQMAKAHGALAAINGDFSSRIVGRPIHAFVEDGTFVQSAGPGASSFAVSQDEQHAMAGATTQVMNVTDSQTSLTWRIDRWNFGAPDVGEIAAFSPAGGSLEKPPAGACSIHLTPNGPATPAANGVGGFDQTFTIDDSACRAGAMSVGNGVVLSTVPGTDEATMFSALPLGTTMTIHLSLGWADAYDVIGGDTMLVHEGQIVVPTYCGSYFCQGQPRTAVGVQADGRLLFVVVDGRQSRYSLGLSMVGFARLMKKLGAVEALNLDGGGASTMVVKGKVVNRPSDGHLRHVASAALILPGPDPGETG
ncbi:MAG: phosphodiester glycosidase family protein [Actinomycetota bacterium]